MRPTGDVLGGRSCKDIEGVPSNSSSIYAPPTSFFLASEDMVEKRYEQAVNRGNSSMFGVESLQETTYDPPLGDDQKIIESDNYNRGDHGTRRRSTLKPNERERDGSLESNEHILRTYTEETSPPLACHRLVLPHSTSESLASMSQNSHVQGVSSPSSLKSISTPSFRHSDEESMDEATSQAITSSGEDETDLPDEIQDSSPQLIMPSIKMPSRRPFTERGKKLGLLKILIAGDSGVGKTSLIKSIVQTCEDIVHVDPLSPHIPTIDHLRQKNSKTRREKSNFNSTHQLTEVYASTRAYPSWWSEIEESKILRRRKSMGDIVLERNLCFVDTPGYNHTASTAEIIESVIQYIETQLEKFPSNHNTYHNELVNMLSGKGGTQVDVVFYMISHKMKPEDLEFIRRLVALTNVIPLIAQADSLSQGEVEVLKRSINSDLQSAGIRTFSFNKDESISSSPYTICSASSNDDENMDASLLMSPDYVQPLVSSELSVLVNQIFNEENIPWLRHLAAKKLVDSHRNFEVSSTSARLNFSPNLYRTQGQNPGYSSSSISSQSSSQAITLNRGGAFSYLRAKTADHMQREEKLAQIRLAKWAGDLQRCLNNERARYQTLLRGERAVWLTQRLSECVNDGSLVPASRSSGVEVAEKATVSRRPGVTNTFVQFSMLNTRDPLGLLKWDEAIRRKGWMAFQVIGGFGVLGAMAVWLIKHYTLGADTCSSWNWTWRGEKL